jgi:hypothetical protein
MLPPAIGGLEVIISNHGAQAAQVFGANSVSGGGAVDTINDVAGTTGVAQMALDRLVFVFLQRKLLQL